MLSISDKFILQGTNDNKDCVLKTNGKIDREEKGSYNLTVGIREKTSRKKRDGKLYLLTL